MVVASPLTKEILDASRRAPVEIHVGNQKNPHPGREGAVDEHMINHFQILLIEAASIGYDLASLG